MENNISANHKVAAQQLGSSEQQQRAQRRQEEFNNQLQQIGKRSLWFSMVIILMCIPNFCYVVLNTPFVKTSTCYFKTRCRVSELENKHWSFEQIHYISAPMNEKIWNCSYYLYNYSKIAEMSYEQALNYIESIDLPNVVPCKEYVHEGCDDYSLYQEFTLVCKSPIFQKILNMSPVYGELIGSLFMVPFSDIVGRKRLVEWGVNIFLGSALITSLADTIVALILGRILTGVAYAIMIYPIESIVLEISNIQLRPFRYVALNIGIGLGYIVMPLLSVNIRHWRHLQWSCCVFLSMLPLTAWYVPESPRWLMSKGKKAKAWSVLRTIKDPVIQSELLLLFRNHKSNYVEEIRAHVKELKPFIFKKLWCLTLLLFLVGCVYFKNYSSHFKKDFFATYPIYLMLSGAAEICGCILCIPMLLILGRRITLAIFFLFASITYFCVSSLEIDTMENVIVLLATDVSTGALYASIYLYVGENVPTSHRCTATGIASGLGTNLATIIMYHIYPHFKTNKILCIFLGAVSLIGSIVSFFTQESRKEGIYDTIEQTTRQHAS